jgi:hypothetical protein
MFLLGVLLGVFLLGVFLLGVFLLRILLPPRRFTKDYCTGLSRDVQST